MIGTVECKWSLMSLGESIDWCFVANKSEGSIWQYINLYHNTSTAQQGHFTPHTFSCAAILICADVNTSKDQKGFKKWLWARRAVVFVLFCTSEKTFFHSVPFGVMYTLCSVLAVLSLVSELTALQLSYATFSVDETCCGCFNESRWLLIVSQSQTITSYHLMQSYNNIMIQMKAEL